MDLHSFAVRFHDCWCRLWSAAAKEGCLTIRTLVDCLKTDEPSRVKSRIVNLNAAKSENKPVNRCQTGLRNATGPGKRLCLFIHRCPFPWGFLFAISHSALFTLHSLLSLSSFLFRTLFSTVCLSQVHDHQNSKILDAPAEEDKQKLFDEQTFSPVVSSQEEERKLSMAACFGESLVLFYSI